MARFRSSAQDLVTEIRRQIGELETSFSVDTPDDRIIDKMDRYLMTLPRRTTEILRGEGVRVREGSIQFQMWKTSVQRDTSGTSDDGFWFASQATTGASAGIWTIYFPTDMGYLEAVHGFEGANYHRTIPVRPTVVRSPRNERYLRENPESRTATPRIIQLEGFANDTAATPRWRMKGTLHPPSLDGIAPVMSVHYYRLPAVMDASAPSTSYPDMDPKFEDVLITGTIASLFTPVDPAYERFEEKERRLILQIGSEAMVQ